MLQEIRKRREKNNKLFNKNNLEPLKNHQKFLQSSLKDINDNFNS